MKDPIKTFFSADEAAALSQLTRTMVDYLCRARVLAPSSPQKRGRGRQRRYSFADVIVLRSLAQMLHVGISVARLQKALWALRKFHAEITPRSLPASHLVTDGKRVYFQHGKDAIQDLTSGQFAFAFVLELTKVKKQVLKQLHVEAPRNSKGEFRYRLR